MVLGVGLREAGQGRGVSGAPCGEDRKAADAGQNPVQHVAELVGCEVTV